MSVIAVDCIFGFCFFFIHIPTPSLYIGQFLLVTHAFIKLILTPKFCFP